MAILEAVDTARKENAGFVRIGLEGARVYICLVLLIGSGKIPAEMPSAMIKTNIENFKEAN